MRLPALFAASIALLAATAAAAPLPERLEATGIGAAGVLAFEPQYALWSDGATKRRWMALPGGRRIDGSDPDAWQFPRGTRLWKEFSVGGRKVETRFITLAADGRWQFASYAWSADGRVATLAPAEGTVIEGVAGAPQGRWEIPSRSDCLVCHASAPVPVLGASALQLSPDLAGLVQRGLLRNYPGPARPNIAAESAEDRAALGMLHANCGHCHNRSANAVPVPLVLAQTAADPAAALARVRHSLTATPSRSTGAPAVHQIVERMRSRDPRRQMPPLGTRIPDADGLALVERWIPPTDPLETTP